MSEEQKAVTQAEVDEHLDNAAKENGYEDLVTWDPSSVAVDMVDCTKAFEECRPSNLIPLIRDWQHRHGGESVSISWNVGPYRSVEVQVPKVAITWAEAKYIEDLVTRGRDELARSNRAALETISLGRQLSITMKSLQAVRGVLVAVQKLRRFGSADSDNPIGAAMPGFIALQDGKELDAAVEAAAKAMEQLAKEYPEDGL